jgi:AcrR family transcriptional regulator
MSPRTQQQFKEIRENRREQIMKVALQIFATEGYMHSSISKLAEKAGISKGLMYNYFNSKEELLTEVLKKGMNEIRELIDPNRDGIISPDEFENLVRQTFQIMKNKQEFWILYISILMQPKVKEQIREKTIIRDMESYFSMFLKYFDAKGFKDPMLEVLTVSCMLEGLGAILIYSYPVMKIPDELLKKYEDRIIQMYK